MNRTWRNVAVAAVASSGLLLSLTATSAVAETAPRPAPAGGAVRVATYNIMKTTGAGGKWSWDHRRVAFQNNVRAADPDVLNVQEASTYVWKGVRHIDDVQQLMSNVGYEIASTNYDTCTPGCTRGAHIFYKPTTMHLATPTVEGVPAVGMTGASIVGNVNPGSIQDRAVSWAFLTPNDSTRTTLYVAVHLPTNKTPEGEAFRIAVASNLKSWADRKIAEAGIPNTELVISGDFNSYARRQPNGAQKIVTDSGLHDGFTAPVKVNDRHGSINYAPKIAKYNGFPPKPYLYVPRMEATRIDYVFSTVTPLRHEVVIVKTAKGKFDNNYRASDHNMVMVDLPLK